MKNLLWLWLCLAICEVQAQAQAQTQTQPAKPETPQEQKPASAAAEPPAPDTERLLTGSIDVGYRWRTDPGGNQNVYRSVVDLGQGPKLLDADFSFLDPKHRWFDRIDTRAANWGDDPYTTLSVAAYKKRTYDFTSSYKNIAYFNAIPSFANPLLDRRVLTSE